MERFQEARDKALKNLKMADHMLHVTYPLVQDPKLLVGVMESLFLSLTNAMAAILWYDRVFKRVPPFQDTFDSKFIMFREKCIPNYKIDKSYITIMQDIKEIMMLHRTSPMEFRRKDRFIICGENYNMKEVTVDRIKDYIKKAKQFMLIMSDIVSRDERIFAGSQGRVEAR